MAGPLAPLRRLRADWRARRRGARRFPGLRRRRSGVAVFYGWARIPDLDEVDHGGMVKLQHMQASLPNTLPPDPCSAIYLVSSRPPPAVDALLAAARRARVPMVWNQNGVAYPAWCPSDPEAVNAPMRRGLGAAERVLYQSAFCKASADRFVGPCPGRWEILHNPVDVEWFRPAAQPAARERTRLLCAGNQHAAYRVRSALDALRCLVDAGLDAEIGFTGVLGWEAPARCRREVDAWVAERGLADRVRWLGSYSQRQAPELYRDADLLLHTKVNDPCPGVVLEALASGLPVVHAASGGVPELVGSEAGIGVPDGSTWTADVPAQPERLADAVLRVLAERDRYAAAARRRAVERFSLAAWLGRHREIFRELAAG